jgi:phosphate-selective porin OprO/OprP
MREGIGKAVLGMLLLHAGSAAAQDAGAWTYDGLRPVWHSAGGDVTLAFRTRLQMDAASYGDGAHLGSGIVARRAYLGAEGDAFARLHYEVRMDFGQARLSSGAPVVNLARASYTFGDAARSLRVNAGLIKPIFTLDDSTSSASLLFLERASVVNVATTGYGGGTPRPGGELTFEQAHLFGADDALMLSGALTGRSTTGGNGGTHLLGRAAYRLWTDDIATVQIGVSAARDIAGVRPHGIDLKDAPELRVDNVALADTGRLLGKGGTLLGAEAAAAFGSFYLAGEYYGFTIDRACAGCGREADFSGWYMEASWIVSGEHRIYLPNAANNNVATFANPRVGHEWGALELATRYSDLDLNWRRGAAFAACGTCVRGGEQRIWTFGLNWYPSDNLKLMLDYMIVEVERLDTLGQPIGRNYHAVATRLQFAN